MKEKEREQGGEEWDMGLKQDMRELHCSKRNI